MQVGTEQNALVKNIPKHTSVKSCRCFVTYIYLFPVASKRKRILKTIQNSPALKNVQINCDICVLFKAHIPINRSLLNFLIYKENLIFFFVSVQLTGARSGAAPVPASISVQIISPPPPLVQLSRGHSSSLYLLSGNTLLCPPPRLFHVMHG